MAVQVWAHRGASGYAPENTLESFALAAEQGADAIELDVQLSRDGELVVIHDETTDRVSGNKAWVKDLTLRELKELNVSLPHPVGFGKTEIPTLREVYELMRPTGLNINVEIKSSIVWYPQIEEKVLELTAQMGMEERVIYSSFNHNSLVKLRKLDPSVKTGLLYEDVLIGVAPYARDTVHVEALHPALYHLQDPDFVRTAHEYGLESHVWTVNEPEHLRMCMEMGVEAVITNYPDRARQIAGEYA